MEKELIKITCADCEYYKIAETNLDWVCPKCNSKRHTVYFSINDEVNLDIKESISGKAISPTKRGEQGKSGKSAKKPIQEFFDGDDYSHKLKKYVDKKRTIDRENDHYHEKVVDKETGEVIHEETEKLSEHYGHGSAKT